LTHTASTADLSTVKPRESRVDAPQTIAPSVGDLKVLIGSFRRHLRAQNLSPRTTTGYTDNANRLSLRP
jgi:hypothetical protein